jgi:hypothetical protein
MDIVAPEGGRRLIPARSIETLLASNADRQVAP